MKIFYFSTALSDEVYKDTVSQCKTFKPTFSGVSFDRNVAMGLSACAEVEAVSYYPIPSYPKYKTLRQEARRFFLDSLPCVAPAMLNLPVLKEFSFCRAAVKYAAEKRSGEGVILVSGLYRCLLRPARMLKKRYGMKVYAIVPDVPELMRTYRKDYSPLRKVLNWLDVRNAAKYRSAVDGFVFLSESMNDMVNPAGKPWMLMEGMCDVSGIPEPAPIPGPNGECYFLYAGKISEKFGVDRLIRGFQLADIPDSQLYLCGDGDLVREVRDAARKDPRIHYLGLVDHKRVLSLEQGAALLIEPRPSDDPLAKMSFPSKILEYMASGTPVLTTGLPCFPEKYREYQYRIHRETPEGIREALLQCMTIPEPERRQMGQNARRFILENKTVAIQCARIARFIGGDSLCVSEETNI